MEARSSEQRTIGHGDGPKIKEVAMASLKEYRWITLVALLAIVVLTPGDAYAQGGTGSIQGTVTGPAGNVVADVNVGVEGTNLTADTDDRGFYRLATVPAGEHTIVFYYLGLQSASAEVTVTAGETFTHDQPLAYGGEIEVRGSPLLVGQAKALNRQKNAINISNIVAADQIGRFPDKNASEARGSIRRPSTASASPPPSPISETSPSTPFRRTSCNRSRSRRP
jgi:hypothetical protein